MAKLIEEIIVIKFSKLVRDTDTDPEPAVTNEQLGELTQVAQAVVGENILVEIERAAL